MSIINLKEKPKIINYQNNFYTKRITDMDEGLCYKIYMKPNKYIVDGEYLGHIDNYRFVYVDMEDNLKLFDTGNCKSTKLDLNYHKIENIRIVFRYIFYETEYSSEVYDIKNKHSTETTFEYQRLYYSELLNVFFYIDGKKLQIYNSEFEFIENIDFKGAKEDMVIEESTSGIYFDRRYYLDKFFFLKYKKYQSIII